MDEEAVNYCSFCKKPIDGIPFKCSYCGQLFCPEHRLPEAHNCPDLPRGPWDGKFFREELDPRAPRASPIAYTRVELPQRGGKKAAVAAVVSIMIFLALYYCVENQLIDDLFKLALKPKLRLYRVRSFSLYLFDTGRLTSFTVEINITDPGQTLIDYQGAGTVKAVVYDAARTETIRFIAEVLKSLSHGDDELYANYAIQITRQMRYFYNSSYDDKVQHPLYTLYLGSGVCIDYALLYASILKAGGLQVAVVIVKTELSIEITWGSSSILFGGHAMVAVRLPHPPRLPSQYHPWAGACGLPLSANITIEGETWYLAEPTPSYEPLNLLRLENIYPTLVGEHNWNRLEVEDIIKL